ncbi:MAG: hypothetical protein GYA17_02200 [Chloroflexi bacterium]|nr:hypothetical protein [Anaerolineaceae bacterium]NMB87141.1 hypothetical protein [Chloroflexota bacterium]
MLLEAHASFNQGDYPLAADLFGRLAEVAEARSLPNAAMLMLQAGRANLLAGKRAPGIEWLYKSVEAFDKTRGEAEAIRIGQRIVAGLRADNLLAEAGEVESWLARSYESRSGTSALTGTPARGKPSIQLPTECPSCGGRIHPQEVEWVDEITVVCGYCGNLIRGELS